MSSVCPDVKKPRQPLPARVSQNRISNAWKALAQATALSNAFGVVSFRYSSATFALATRAAKACGSWIAMSDSTLRSISMPDLFRPSMKRRA